MPYNPFRRIVKGRVIDHGGHLLCREAARDNADSKAAEFSNRSRSCISFSNPTTLWFLFTVAFGTATQHARKAVQFPSRGLFSGNRKFHATNAEMRVLHA